MEAGAQGDHKIARGYNPVKTFSLHFFENFSFNEMINDYLEKEKKYVSKEILDIQKFLPYKNERNNNGKI